MYDSYSSGKTFVSEIDESKTMKGRHEQHRWNDNYFLFPAAILNFGSSLHSSILIGILGNLDYSDSIDDETLREFV